MQTLLILYAICIFILFTLFSIGWLADTNLIEWKKEQIMNKNSIDEMNKQKDMN